MAYTYSYLNKVIEKLRNAIQNRQNNAQKGLTGIYDNVTEGGKCEIFIENKIKKVTKKVFRTPGSHSKFDVIAIENRQNGIILHFIQVKSSENKDAATKYSGTKTQKDELLKEADWMKKQSEVPNIIGYSIGWARVFNPQDAGKNNKNLVDITLIEYDIEEMQIGKVLDFYTKICPKDKLIDISEKRKEALAKAKVKAKKIYKYAEKQLKQNE